MGKIGKTWAEKKNTLAKKLVWMKGQWTPRGYIRFLGWAHKRKALLAETPDGYTSPFMASRQSDYASYCARLYKVTAKCLRKHQRLQSDLEILMKDRKEELESCMEQLIAQPEEIRDKRLNKKLKLEMNRLNEEYQRLERQHEEITQIIDYSNLETEELKYSRKSKVEAQLHNYLQGARCFAPFHLPEIREDEKSVELYDKYCEMYAIEFCVKKKEADTYA